jgi:hypothetical protein
VSTDPPSTPDPVTLSAWSMLLAKWVELAQASVAFPKTADGDRWRAAVPAIIGLQAVACALGEVDTIPAAERGIAIDRAEVLTRTHIAQLHGLWRGEPLPDLLAELIADARHAAHAARHSGLAITVVSGVAMLRSAQDTAAVGGAMVEAGFSGTLWLAAPGVAIGPGSVLGFLRNTRGGSPPPALHPRLREIITSALAPSVLAPVELAFEPVPEMLQVYRTVEAPPHGTGPAPASTSAPAPNPGPAPTDRLTRFDAELPPGRPLLVAVLDAGQPVPPPSPLLYGGLGVPAVRVLR